MSRLPTPGQDDGTWGDVLNDFLAQEHTSGGSLRIRTDGTLDAKEATANKGQAGGYAPLDGGGKVPTANLPAGTVTPDARNTTKGIVQLTGDLGGTAASPTVPGLAAKADSSTVAAKADDSAVVHKTGDTMTGKLVVPSFQVTGGSPSGGNVLTADSSGNATWQTPSGSGGSSTLAGDSDVAIATPNTGQVLT